MPYSCKVLSPDAEGVTVELLDGDTSVKQLRKTYSSFEALQGLVNRWYKGKKFAKVTVPSGGWFSHTPEQAAPHLQAFLNEVIQTAGDTFPVKYFFRLYDLRGKVVIVTGASSGIGKQNAYQLAEMGAHVILACRSEPKTLPIVADIKAKTGNENIEFMKIDLMSLTSVTEFVEAFKARNLPLHVLLNNAGTVLDGKTEYDIDATYGANQVGPFFLTMSLLDLIHKQENGRIVFVASKVARAAKGLPYDKIKKGIKLSYLRATEAYSYSKLANVCTAKTLAKKFKDEGIPTKVYSVHPGVVATDIYRDLPATLVTLIKKFMINEEEGSLTQLYCAIDDGCAADSGAYFSQEDIAGGGPGLHVSLINERIPESDDEAMQKLSWDETSKMCGLAE